VFICGSPENLVLINFFGLQGQTIVHLLGSKENQNLILSNPQQGAKSLEISFN
jgi:hypothetical protein